MSMKEQVDLLNERKACCSTCSLITSTFFFFFRPPLVRFRALSGLFQSLSARGLSSMGKHSVYLALP